jgi:hypothetical protein
MALTDVKGAKGSTQATSFEEGVVQLPAKGTNTKSHHEKR